MQAKNHVKLVILVELVSLVLLVDFVRFELFQKICIPKSALRIIFPYILSPLSLINQCNQ